jgi:TM2 domain-containing membrane protein YozV
VVPESAKGPDWNGAINGAVDSFKDLFGSKSGTAATPKNRFVAALLAFFLGSLGIQHFYMGNKWFGVATLVLLVTPLAPLCAIVGFVHAVLLFLMTDDKFHSQCNKHIKK